MPLVSLIGGTHVVDSPLWREIIPRCDALSILVRTGCREPSGEGKRCNRSWCFLIALLGPNLATKGFTPVNYQGSQDYRRRSVYLPCGNLVAPTMYVGSLVNNG